MSETKNYSISVKDLASQVHAAGDLGGKASSKITAIEGTKLHKLFQAEEEVLASEVSVMGSYEKQTVLYILFIFFHQAFN